jgi:hypothetical protein
VEKELVKGISEESHLLQMEIAALRQEAAQQSRVRTASSACSREPSDWLPWMLRHMCVFVQLRMYGRWSRTASSQALGFVCM